MAKTCEVCGAYSGFFPICKNCNDLKDKGIVYKDERTGKWLKKQKNSTKNEANRTPEEQKQQKDGKCIVCGEDAPNGSLCIDCWHEMLEYKDSFDKNSKSFELREYYFNLRSNIYRMKNFEYIQSNCNKLMALAVLTKDLYNDESLTARIVTDIKDLIEKKKPKEQESNPTSKQQEHVSRLEDSRKTEIFRSDDGHYVKSDSECIIDDILYNLRIVHCYEKRVPINEEEQTMMCDWFIPVKDSVYGGIYIEYWGMNTKSYLQNKERKREAYKKYDIPLIEIEKDDPKDKRMLSERLLCEINSIAEKRFKIINFIKIAY